MLRRLQKKDLFGRFNPDTVDNWKGKFDFDGRKVDLYLWDSETSGEDYDALRILTYQETDVFVYVYSAISRYALNRLKKYYYDDSSDFYPEVAKILVCNQVDLRPERKGEKVKCPRTDKLIEPIGTLEGIHVAKELGLDGYVETSAKTNYHIFGCSKKIPKEPNDIDGECGILSAICYGYLMNMNRPETDSGSESGEDGKEGKNISQLKKQEKTKCCVQ